MNGTSTPYNTGPKGMDGESGALDNVLTLNPNDPRWEKDVAHWKDDTEYMFEHVRVRQVSPGQFEVLSAKVEEEGEMPTEDEAAQRAAEKTPQAPTRGSYSNPAVENLEL